MSLIQETTKIANLKEQLSSMKTNINIANNELFILLNSKETIVSSVKVLKEEEVLLIKWISKESKAIKSKRKGVDVFEHNIKERQRKLESDIIEFNLFKVNELDNIEDKKRIALQKIDEHKSKLKKSKLVLGSLSDDIIKKESISVKLDSEINKKRDNFNKIEKDSRVLQEDSITLLRELNSKIKEEKLKLSKQEELVEEEKNKIVKPMQLLKGKEYSLNKKERNLRILEGRLKKRYKKLFPNNEFPKI